MPVILYITHPQVEVDFTLPVTAWRLSETGRGRMTKMLTQPWLRGIARVISSEENKALEAARMLCAQLHVPLEVRSGTGENDRTATGPLPPDEFGRVADLFFAHPDQSIRGWERAIDAQQRITGALADLFDPTSTQDVAVIGHGGVGTLWYCHLAALPIDRRYDQPSQGHYLSVDRASGQPLHAWRPIDEVRPA